MYNVSFYFIDISLSVQSISNQQVPPVGIFKEGPDISCTCI